MGFSTSLKILIYSLNLLNEIFNVNCCHVKKLGNFMLNEVF